MRNIIYGRPESTRASTSDGKCSELVAKLRPNKTPHWPMSASKASEISDIDVPYTYYEHNSNAELFWKIKRAVNDLPVRKFAKVRPSKKGENSTPECSSNAAHIHAK